MGDRTFPSLLVTGDFGPDSNVYLPTVEGRSSPGVPQTRFSRSLGGAVVIHDLLAEVKKQVAEAGAGSVEVHFFADPAMEEPTCQPVAGLWFPQEGGPLLAPQKTKVWRLKTSLGLGEAIGVEKLPKDPLPERCGPEFDPNILVVEDDAGKFRFQPTETCWPNALEGKGEPPNWIVLKMTAPVCQGDLWWHLVRKGGPADRLVVVLPVSDLRKEDVRISQGISWERTVEDLVRELSESPVLAGLQQARHVVVVLNEEGAVWVRRTATNRREFRLIFDPRNMEMQWQEGAGINGSTYGFLSSFVAALAARIALSENWEAEPEIERGIEDGLRAVRLLHLLGHGNVDAKQPGFPFAALAGQIVAAALPNASKKPPLAVDPEKLGYFGTAAIPAHVPEGKPSPGKDAAAKEPCRSWRLLYSADADVPRPPDEPLYGVARRVALLGLRELRNAPFASFGGFVTADRDEIEALHNIKRLVEDYQENGKDEKKPLSIAVFGPPGAGKSFAIEEIAAGVLGKKTPFLVFNLSQFADVSDLIGAFHQVRDKVLEGTMPVVFWDEFDSGSYKWLQYLLAPMQDGRFQERQVTHAIGRCIFVFAGATSYDLENFGPCRDDEKAREKFRLLKGPDFTSRLHGFLNVLGPNRRQVCHWSKVAADVHRRDWKDDSKDVCFPVRRALLLRAKLGLVGDRADERMDIDHGLLSALLEVDCYTHGARSMGKIIHSLRQAKDFELRRSGLPTDEVLRMNTKRDQFLRLASGSQDFQKQAQYLAPVIHDFYRGLGKKEGWTFRYDMPYDQLPEPIKADNAAAAHRIPWILSLAGLYLVEGKPDSEEETQMVRRVIEAHLYTLAREEHDLWMAFRLKNGWTNGEERNDDEKIHSSLEPFDELDDKDRKKDENSVRNFPAIADRAGFRIVPRRPG